MAVAEPLDVPAARRGAKQARPSTLLRVVWRRLLQAIPVLLGVTFLTFALLNLLPGSPALAILGDGATPQQIASLNDRLGLDRPFFTRYVEWLGHAVSGNLGASLQSGQSVASIIGDRLPVSAELIILAFGFSLATAVPIAILAARRPRGIVDRANTIVSMAGLSMPGFVLGLLLVLIVSVKLHWLPAVGYTPVSAGLWANLRTFILPAVTIAFPLYCHYTRVLRSDLVEHMSSEAYVVTARAKGASTWRILLRHALRNAAFGTLTLVGLSLGTMIGNTILVEEIFGLPGIGQALINGILNRDLYVVEAIVAITAITVLTANLLTDISYAALDPRVRRGRAET